jgi:HSP20 family molecular chaperone IbpA
MTGQAARPQRAKAKTLVNLVPIQSLSERIQEMHNLIARRAYELYEGRGCEPGHDLEDWCRAESELLPAVPAGFMQSDRVLIVDAAVPGFDAETLQVSVEPRRITLIGKREAATEAGSRPRSLEIFRVVDLPVEVDPSRTTATLKRGILEVVAPKAGKATVESKAA